MRNMKPLNGDRLSGLGMGVLALLVASFLLILPGCRGPLAPPPAAGDGATGTLSVTLDGPPAQGRTIMPDGGQLAIEGFDRFVLSFTPGPGNPTPEEHVAPVTWTTPTGTLSLPVGVWDVVVEGFVGTGTPPIARGTGRVTIVSDDTTTLSIPLHPVMNVGHGTGIFAWNIVDWNPNIATAIMNIINLYNGATHYPNTSILGSNDSRSLPTGEYRVVFRLTSTAGEVVEISEILRVYQGLISTFNCDGFFGSGFMFPEALLDFVLYTWQTQGSHNFGGAGIVARHFNVLGLLGVTEENFGDLVGKFGNIEWQSVPNNIYGIREIVDAALFYLNFDRDVRRHITRSAIQRDFATGVNSGQSPWLSGSWGAQWVGGTRMCVSPYIYIGVYRVRIRFDGSLLYNMRFYPWVNPRQGEWRDLDIQTNPSEASWALEHLVWDHSDIGSFGPDSVGIYRRFTVNTDAPLFSEAGYAQIRATVGPPSFYAVLSWNYVRVLPNLYGTIGDIVSFGHLITAPEWVNEAIYEGGAVVAGPFSAFELPITWAGSGAGTMAVRQTGRTGNAQGIDIDIGGGPDGLGLAARDVVTIRGRVYAHGASTVDQSRRMEVSIDGDRAGLADFESAFGILDAAGWASYTLRWRVPDDGPLPTTIRVTANGDTAPASLPIFYISRVEVYRPDAVPMTGILGSLVTAFGVDNSSEWHGVYIQEGAFSDIAPLLSLRGTSAEWVRGNPRTGGLSLRVDRTSWWGGLLFDEGLSIFQPGDHVRIWVRSYAVESRDGRTVNFNTTYWYGGPTRGRAEIGWLSGTHSSEVSATITQSFLDAAAYDPDREFGGSPYDSGFQVGISNDGMDNQRTIHWYYIDRIEIDRRVGADVGVVFDGFADGAPTELTTDMGEISLLDAEVLIELLDPYRFDSVDWFVGGRNVNAYVVREPGVEYLNLASADIHGNLVGRYSVTILVDRGGVPYSRRINFRVVP